MNKEKTFRLTVVSYIAFVLMIAYWFSRMAVFNTLVGQSKIEILNSGSLSKAQNSLSQRNYSIIVGKIEIDNYDFGNNNPFQETYATTE